MKRSGLEYFGAYRKSIELFDLVVLDMEPLKGEFTLGRLVSQQLASADSLCANIEEGYGRLSRKEYIRFLDFARGSARETRGRYLRMRHWLTEDLVRQRTGLLDEIIGILTSTITTLNRGLSDEGRGSRVHETTALYDSEFSREPTDARPLSTHYSTP